MRSNRLFSNNPVRYPRRILGHTIAQAIAIFTSLPGEIQTLALAAAATSALPVATAQDRKQIVKNVFFRDHENISNYYASFYDNEGNTEYSIDLDTIISNFTSQCNMTVVTPSNFTDFTYIAGYMNMYDVIVNGVDFFRKTGDDALEFFENCFKESAQHVFTQNAEQNNLGYYIVLAIMMVVLMAGCASMLFQMRDGIGCCQAIIYYNDPIIRSYRDGIYQRPDIVDIQEQKEQEQKILNEGGYPITVIIDEDQKEQAPVQPIPRGSPLLLTLRSSPLQVTRRTSPLRTFSVINTALQQPLLSKDEEDTVDEDFSPMTPL